MADSMEPKQIEEEVLTLEKSSNEEMISNGCLQTLENNILAVIANYSSELEILSFLKQLRNKLNPRRGWSRDSNFDEDDMACVGFVTGSGRILQKIVDLEAALSDVRGCQISHHSRIYEMTAVEGISLTLPVRICGFRAAMDEMPLLLLAFLKEVVIPSGKRYIIFYAAYDLNLLLTSHGVNVLNKGQDLCEMVTRSEGLPGDLLKAFVRGDLQGLFLPVDAVYESKLLEDLVGNVSYFFNFYLPPPMLKNQIRSYWKRVYYSRWVQSPYGLTVVDFVDDVQNRKLYEGMLLRKGFHLTGSSYPNYFGIRENLKPPPLPPCIKPIQELRSSPEMNHFKPEPEQIPANESPQFSKSVPVVSQNNISLSLIPIPDSDVPRCDNLKLIRKNFARNPSFKEFQDFRRKELLKSPQKLDEVELKRTHPDLFYSDERLIPPNRKKIRFDPSTIENPGPLYFQSSYPNLPDNELQPRSCMHAHVHSSGDQENWVSLK